MIDRLLAGVVIAATALAAVSVPGRVGSTAPTDPLRCAPAQDVEEIVVWHSLRDAAEAELLAQVDRFNDAHDLVTVVAEKPGNFFEVTEQLIARPPAERPDIVLAPEGAIRGLHSGGATVPPSACTGTRPPFDDLLGLAEATYTVDGELVAVPYAISTPVLVFNATVATAAGLDPSRPPLTLDEVTTWSRRIVERGAAGSGLVVYDQYGAWFVRQWAAQEGRVLAEPANGHDSVAVVVDLDAPSAVAGLERLASGVDEGVFRWIGGNGSGINDFAHLVQAEDAAAMTLHTSAALGDVIALLEAGAFRDGALGVADLGVGPLPGPAAPGALVGGVGLWLVDAGDPARVGAAWSFVEWLMDPVRLAALAARTGYVPPRAAAIAEPELASRWATYPQLRVAYDQLSALPVNEATAGAVLGPGLALDGLLNSATSWVMEGADPAEALAEAEADYMALQLAYEAAIGN